MKVSPTPSDLPAAEAAFSTSGSLAALARSYAIIIVLFILCGISALFTPTFLTADNLTNILRQVSVITIIAFGETMLIIAGMVDLAPGSVAALAGCVAIGTFLATDSILLAVVSAILIGAATGLTSGFIVTKYRVPSFIMTLAMMTVARGLVFIYTKGFPIYNIGAISHLGKGDILGVPIPVVVMLALAVFSGVLLSRTRFGRYLYAIGGSEDAAVAAGIKVRRIKVLAFVLCGIFSGIGGVLLMARLNSGQPAAGVGYEFDAITGAIIGGTSFTGGVGTIQGTLAGCLIVGVINNVLNLLSVPSYYQQVVKGMIIVIAVVFDLKTRAVRTRNLIH
ncbi:MAG TPA: ABC transporter permease [Terrimicrobiaceae bacterium]